MIENELVIPTYSISEAHKKSISSIVKEAEREGFVVLNRNDAPVAIVIPLQLVAHQNYIKKLSELIETDIKSDSVPEEYKSFAYFLRAMIGMQMDMFKKF